MDLGFLEGLPEEAAREVHEYLRGFRREFSRSLVDSALAQEGTEFQREIWKAIAYIPYGAVRTYGEVAYFIGRPGAARAVGTACGRNKWPIIIPCHRVVGSGGIGGYALGVEMKKRLLKLEGVSYDM
jgi:methylated-DNA-[protein]-cysteine S-methyltransferase